MATRAVMLALLLAAAQALQAEEDVQGRLQAMQAQIEKLSQRLEAQQQTIDEQKKKIQEQQNVLASITSKAPIAGASDRVLERLERVERLSGDAIKIASRKKPNDLNMSIGSAIDTSFRAFDGTSSHTDRPGGSDFTVRGAELVFYADVDPFFKTYMVLNATPDLASNDEAVPTLEEAAMYTTSLSHVSVKGGRFFMPFGRLSMIHDHDLPFTTRPPSLGNYVGGESQGDGVQVTALIPIDHFLQITGGVFNKAGAEFPIHPVGTRRDGEDLTYFTKALTSFDYGQDHTFEWGVSSLQVPDSNTRRDLLNMEITYKWHPQGIGLRERLVWGTELMRNNLRSTLTIPPDVEGNAPTFMQKSRTGSGGYTYLEYFIDRNWSVGPRVDLFQNVDPNVSPRHNLEQTYTAFLTYKFSEFSRLRFEYDRHEYFDGRKANEAYLQWTVFWGAHTHNFDLR